MSSTVEKLRVHCERLGVWDDLFDFSIEHAAHVLVRTAELEDEALKHGLSPLQVEGHAEWRNLARQVMAEWLIIGDYSHLALLDEWGRDAELRRFLNSGREG